MTLRSALAATMTEDQLLAGLIEHAQFHGWLAYHTHDSRRSAEGFPDLVLLRPPDLILWELKTEKGKVSAEQQVWLDRLAEAHTIEAALIRPADYDRCLQRLARRPRPRV